MNLLLRFYDPTSGAILLDGVDTKELSVRWLRSQIGYVGQEPKLFAGSVATNIQMGRVIPADVEKNSDGSTTDLLPTLKTLHDAMEVAGNEQQALYAQKAAACGPCGRLCVNPFCDLSPKVDDKEAATGGDIELGKNNASRSPIDPDVQSACTAAYAHDFILSFPQGYDTDVGESSILVSGGQKQRIAIARALIRNPSVLLLDEATSALDASSERFVQQSIDTLQQSRAQTTIVIAHRLSTIRNADKIIVVDKGAVVESGTHDGLVARNGLYTSLWNKQGGNSSTGLHRGNTGKAFSTNDESIAADAATAAAASPGGL
jgi:ABC-type transport system involved in Fe-S cluster assembly fused permease/ATPase subunit